ncbi:MAG: membrane dipeptidase [Gemmataceae bacterium]|nr:membrane dipeptidase [Gemmataceae bacterium]MDW8264883.1 membrane dipeptidase [Gemmataceae bacterium]
MLVFDAHLDLAWNAIDWNRDLRLPVSEIRRREQEAGLTDKGRGNNTVSLPELRRGRVAVVIATLLARLLRIGAIPAIQRYASMEAAHGAAYGQLAYYRALERQGHLRWIKDAATLQRHIQAWEASDDGTEPIGFILSMEGADPVLRPEEVEEWYQAGLRIIGPAHYGPSPYALGHDQVGGLLPQGPALLREMQRVGMILDVTHLSDRCFDEALDIYGGPILASHHNCRSLVPNPRQLTDDQIKRIVARGGVIGAALDTWMMVPNWIRGETDPVRAGANLEKIVDHFDHICQLAGSARHCAIGSDLDGGFGREQSPYDLDTIADLQKLPELLQRRGYRDEAIRGIMYQNWVRFFTEAWS